MNRQRPVNDARPLSHARGRRRAVSPAHVYTPMPPMIPEVAHLRRQSAHRKYIKALRYVRYLWICAGVLLIAFAMMVVIALCISPRFWIFRLEVHGAETLSTAEVIRLACLPAKSNYYRTSLRELEQRILREPRVQTVEIHRQSVGVLDIALHERQAVCQVGHSQPLTYLDRDGYLFVRPFPPAFPVPVAERLPAPTRADFARPHVDGAYAAVLSCLAALRDKAPNDPELPVTRLLLNPQGKLVLVLRQGTRIYLGDPDDLTRKMLVVRKTVVEAQQQGYALDNLDYIDAKVIERVASQDDGKDAGRTITLGAVYKPKNELGKEAIAQ